MPPEPISTFLFPLLAAIGCGAIVGAEREWTRHDAGLRTNALVALGAALFTLVSIYGFEGSGTDTSRVAAGIVTGVGFLGAGVILHRRSRVIGLTTSATLWVAAGLGMAAGTGEYALAWGAALIVLLLQVLLRTLETHMNKLREAHRGTPHQYYLFVDTPGKVDLALSRVVRESIGHGDLRLIRVSTKPRKDRGHRTRLTLETRQVREMRSLEALLRLAGYQRVRWNLVPPSAPPPPKPPVSP